MLHLYKMYKANTVILEVIELFRPPCKAACVILLNSFGLFLKVKQQGSHTHARVCVYNQIYYYPRVTTQMFILPHTLGESLNH